MYTVQQVMQSLTIIFEAAKISLLIVDLQTAAMNYLLFMCLQANLNERIFCMSIC